MCGFFNGPGFELGLRSFAGRAAADSHSVDQRAHAANPRLVVPFGLPEFGSAASETEVGLSRVLQGAAFANPALVDVVVVAVVVVVLEGVDHVAGDQLEVAVQTLAARLRLIRSRRLKVMTDVAKQLDQAESSLPKNDRYSEFN